MPELASLVGWSALAMLAVSTLTFVAECLVALAPARPARSLPPPPPFAVLIPAHDEAAGIAATVAAARAQLRPGDRLLVVADNCTDATARQALAAGATVRVRTDPMRRGKGYALDAGRAALSPDPPAVVVVLDADCLPEPGALAVLAAAAAAGKGAAVQGLYLMSGCGDDAARSRLSAFAFLVKNLVRQRALARMGSPALLQGTGMAFPWAIFAAAPLGGPAIVEDMELGLHLARAGTPVRFLEQAVFRSPAAPVRALAAQRTRWEHGSLGAAWRHLPVLAASLVRGRRDLAPLVLDLTVPPLALLVMALVAHAALALLAAAATGAGPGAWAACLPMALAGAVLATWFRFGRGVLPAGALLRVPMYLLWKLPVYARLIGARQRAWVRTDRG